MPGTTIVEQNDEWGGEQTIPDASFSDLRRSAADTAGRGLIEQRVPELSDTTRGYSMTHNEERTLGTRLKEARLRWELSQEDVAKDIGIHPVTISKYERGAQDPNARTLIDLARIYDVSVDWLLTEHEDIIHHNPLQREARKRVVISFSSLVLRVVEGTFSDEAIVDITTFVQYLHWRYREIGS